MTNQAKAAVVLHAPDQRGMTPSRLAAALIVVLAVTALRYLLRGALGTNVPFIFYFPTIMVVAWFMGTGCAIIAAAIATVFSALLFEPPGSGALAPLRSASFVGASGLIIWVSYLLRRGRAELVAAGRKEESLRRWYEVMLDSIAESTIGVDPNGCITFLNRAARELAGTAAADARGKPLLEVFDLIEDATGKRASGLDAIERNGRGWTLETKAGQALPVIFGMSPLRNEDSGIGGAVLVLRIALDERERERLVAEAILARANAEAANRMKDDFLRMVSHELRAPLNAILGWADVMTRKNDAATVTKGAETIRRNVRVQSALIDSMLDVAAIAAGRFAISRRPIDIHEVIEEARRSIEPIVQAKKLNLIEDIDRSSKPDFLADPSRLQQVLANLYSNAIKFTPSGGSITTRLKFLDRVLVIEVEDSGQGMDAATTALLFERSAHGNNTLARSKSGLGIGLRIARRIVELHGGHLAASSPGEQLGTRVSITLPFDLSEASPAGAGLDQDALARLVGKKILVVDDDTQATLLFANVLEDLGAIVQSADSAHRAFELMQRFEPDALISDIGMTPEDGYWLIKAVRKRQAERGGAHLPAVAVTAYARPEDRERARIAGFDLHFAKPVAARAVAHALGEAFGAGTSSLAGTARATVQE